MIFRSQMAALLANDIEAVLQHFAADCRLVDMAEPDNPFVGHQGLRSFLDSYFKAWRIDDITIVNLVAQDQRVAAEVELLLTARDGSGQQRIRSSLFDEFRDGQIVLERAYRDPAGRKE